MDVNVKIIDYAISESDLLARCHYGEKKAKTFIAMNGGAG